MRNKKQSEQIKIPTEKATKRRNKTFADKNSLKRTYRADDFCFFAGKVLFCCICCATLGNENFGAVVAQLDLPVAAFPVFRPPLVNAQLHKTTLAERDDLTRRPSEANSLVSEVEEISGSGTDSGDEHVSKLLLADEKTAATEERWRRAEDEEEHGEKEEKEEEKVMEEQRGRRQQQQQKDEARRNAAVVVNGSQNLELDFGEGGRHFDNNNNNSSSTFSSFFISNSTANNLTKLINTPQFPIFNGMGLEIIDTENEAETGDVGQQHRLKMHYHRVLGNGLSSLQRNASNGNGGGKGEEEEEEREREMESVLQNEREKNFTSTPKTLTSLPFGRLQQFHVEKSPQKGSNNKINKKEKSAEMLGHNKEMAAPTAINSIPFNTFSHNSSFSSSSSSSPSHVASVANTKNGSSFVVDPASVLLNSTALEIDVIREEDDEKKNGEVMQSKVGDEKTDEKVNSTTKFTTTTARGTVELHFVGGASRDESNNNNHHNFSTTTNLSSPRPELFTGGDELGRPNVRDELDNGFERMTMLHLAGADPVAGIQQQQQNNKQQNKQQEHFQNSSAAGGQIVVASETEKVGEEEGMGESNKQNQNSLTTTTTKDDLRISPFSGTPPLSEGSSSSSVFANASFLAALNPNVSSNVLLSTTTIAAISNLSDNKIMRGNVEEFLTPNNFDKNAARIQVENNNDKNITHHQQQQKPQQKNMESSLPEENHLGDGSGELLAAAATTHGSGETAATETEQQQEQTTSEREGLEDGNNNNALLDGDRENPREKQKEREREEKHEHLRQQHHPSRYSSPSTDEPADGGNNLRIFVLSAIIIVLLATIALGSIFSARYVKKSRQLHGKYRPAAYEMQTQQHLQNYHHNNTNSNNTQLPQNHQHFHHPDFGGAPQQQQQHVSFSSLHPPPPGTLSQQQKETIQLEERLI